MNKVQLYFSLLLITLHCFCYASNNSQPSIKPHTGIGIPSFAIKSQEYNLHIDLYDKDSDLKSISISWGDDTGKNLHDLSGKL